MDNDKYEEETICDTQPNNIDSKVKGLKKKKFVRSTFSKMLLVILFD